MLNLDLAHFTPHPLPPFCLGAFPRSDHNQMTTHKPFLRRSQFPIDATFISWFQWVFCCRGSGTQSGLASPRERAVCVQPWAEGPTSRQPRVAWDCSVSLFSKPCVPGTFRTEQRETVCPPAKGPLPASCRPPPPPGTDPPLVPVNACSPIPLEVW